MIDADPDEQPFGLDFGHAARVVDRGLWRLTKHEGDADNAAWIGIRDDLLSLGHMLRACESAPTVHNSNQRAEPRGDHQMQRGVAVRNKRRL